MVVKIAHRGDPLRFRENTMPSLESAIQGGADWVEIDIKLTRDLVPVLLHDDSLKRLWGVDRRIASLSHDEMHRLVGDGEWRVPLLREALELAADRRTTLMLDIPSPAAGQAAIDLVHKLDCAQHVVYAGNSRALAAIRARAPRACIAMSWSHPRLPNAELLGHVRPDYMNRRHIWVTGRNVRHVQRQGMMVCAWTVDSRRRMASLARAGIDAITTNDIRSLVTVLNGHHR
ncbi:MAG: glycerophosphodiester phosphodiesterase [Streptomycetaceae bacterium]|nr:glycerophosphodiester phosphodiesterase [Streptomycetaceae bacterium]